MLSAEQLASYRENGYLLVEDAITPEQLQTMREVTYDFIERARAVSESNDVYDLDQGHGPNNPKLTRIKLPHKQHPAFAETLRSSRMRDHFQAFLGPNVVLQNVQAQHQGAGRRGCGRMAPGLGVLPAHQRRHVGVRHHA